jgi:hypothetical protein
MPEVVDPDSWECRLIEGSMKPLRRPGPVDWSSDWRRKDESGVVPVRPERSKLDRESGEWRRLSRIGEALRGQGGHEGDKDQK